MRIDPPHPARRGLARMTPAVQIGFGKMEWLIGIGLIQVPHRGRCMTWPYDGNVLVAPAIGGIMIPQADTEKLPNHHTHCS